MTHRVIPHLAAAVAVFFGVCGIFGPTAVFATSTAAERAAFNRKIVDYRRHVNPRFPKQVRRETRYVIVHTSEAGRDATLRVITDGKRDRRHRRTYGGHAHYVIARDGTTYRTLDKLYRADHAGLSMWNGRADVSDFSIGIELVGYHHTAITSAQYRSLGLLIDILQGVYALDDRDVLTHSQVAYGTTNRWVRGDHRGRKRCAKNFVRAKAGLGSGWPYDPDVRAQRLKADHELAAIYYGPDRNEERIAGRSPVALAGIGLLPASDAEPTNVITPENTAWNIAGEDHDASDTLYRLPDGTVVRGDELGGSIGWDRIPPGTQVLLNTSEASATQNEGPMFTVSDGHTAWTFAGADFDKSTTIYFFPDGQVRTGSEIADWDAVPAKTRMLVGYQGHRITATRPPVIIDGERYRDARTLYSFPDGTLLTGAQVQDFRQLPRGAHMLVPVTRP